MWSAPCRIMPSISSLPSLAWASTRRPCWMTTVSSRSLTSALSTMRSSTVFSVMRRNTRTALVCPIR
uniref:Putative secreted protein n=1 Tax=Ixodes ricinus TaxID=34613 RepID=A0A6B0TZ33_IXORI